MKKKLLHITLVTVIATSLSSATTTYASLNVQQKKFTKKAECCCNKEEQPGHVQDVATDSENSLQFVGAWARPAVINGNSAVYLTISNQSDENIEIVGIEAEDVAHKIELHQSIDNNGTMSMSKIDHLLVPTKTNFVLTRGGFHIMLMRLKKSLIKGESFDLTFILKNNVKKTIKVTVRSS